MPAGELDDLMSLPDKFTDYYREFEDAHRGSLALIRERQRIYLPIIEKIARDHPAGRRALDVGCGRGEWLGLIAEHGWDAIGVDSNPSMAAVALSSGVRVHVMDALEYLHGCDDASFGLITAFHVVEHVDTEALTGLLMEIERVLMPGGVIILETPNPENLTVSSWSFYMDPTHKAPLPPALLQFFVRGAGLRDPAILRLNSQFREPDGSPIASPMAGLFVNSPDYSVIASKGGSDAIAHAIEQFVAQASDGGPTDIPALIAEIKSFAAAAREIDEVSVAAERLSTVVDRLERKISRLRRADEHLQGGVARLDDGQAKLEWELSSLRSQLTELRKLPLIRLLRGAKRLRRSISQHLRTAFGGEMTPRQVMGRLDRQASTRYRRLKAYFRKSCAATASPPVPDFIPLTERSATGKLLGYGEHLGYQRLAYALELARLPVQTVQPSRPKPRLAFVSPLPPEKSGIADYSAQILPALRQHYEIDIISAQEAINDAWVLAHCTIRTVDWFKANAHYYDRILYHIGNSTFHQHMFPLLQQIPGVVVLHDFYLGNITAHLELYSGWRKYWVNALLHSHGYVAVKGRFNGDLRRVIYHYPVNFGVLEQAQGIIVHSHHARELSQQFYPSYDSDGWRIIPLARRVLSSATKASARRDLGFSEGDTVVCSFGFIQDTKLSHRLLDAWLASDLAADRRYHLVFVGELPRDPYGDMMRSRVESPASSGRVHITGFVSGEAYGLYLQAADIGVQLRAFSRGETSAAVLDCLRHGLATIVNANGSMAELPADCVLRLEDQFETTTLVQALERLCNDVQERRRLGAAARAHMDEHHDPVRIADQYREAIEDFTRQASPLHNLPMLVEHARQLMSAGRSDEDALLREVAAIREKGGEQQPVRRLFVDVSALVREDLRTGIQRVVRALLLQLLHAPPPGYRVEPVWLGDGEGRWRYYHARAYTMQLLGLDPGLWPDAPIELAKGDIFLGADFFPVGVMQANVAGLYDEWRARGVRIGFVLYDVLPVVLPACFPPSSEAIHRDWLLVVAAKADDLVCISASVAEAAKKWLRANVGEDRKLPAIHAWALGADIDASSPTKGIPADGEALLARLRGVDSFLMVGTIEPRKGHLQVLEAFESLWAVGHEVNLVIVGNPGWTGVPPDQARNLPEIIERLRNHPELGKRLIWLQGVSDEFLDSIYREADCLIAASLDEGYGLPLIEAARHDLPVLARDIAVFREVAGDAAAYFSATDGLGLAGAIEQWLKVFREDRHPKPAGMKWLTWSESAERLKQIVIRDGA